MNRDLRLLLAGRVAMTSVRALGGVVIPIYLAERGFSGTRLGALFVTGAVVSTLLTLLVGLYADRLGRLRFVIGIPLLTAVGALGFAVSTAPAVLFAAAAVGSIGRGSGAAEGQVGPYQPAEQALVTDLSPAGRRNAVFAVFASGSSAGALFGALCALLPQAARNAGLGTFASYRLVFGLMAVLAVAAALIAVPVRAPERPRDAQGPRRLTWPRASRHVLYRLWLANGVNGVAFGLYAPFISYWLHVRYGVGAGTVGILYAVINLVSIGTNLTAAPFARRIGDVRAITAARLVQAGLLVPMVLMPTFWAAGLVYLVRVAGFRVGMPVRQSFVMGITDPEERSAVAGLAPLPNRVGSSVSPLLGGYLFDEVALAVPFELAAVALAGSAFLFYRLFRNEHAADDPAPAEVSQAAGVASTAMPAARRQS